MIYARQQAIRDFFPETHREDHHLPSFAFRAGVDGAKLALGSGTGRMAAEALLGAVNTKAAA
jgi:hypothetical protein